MKITIDDGITEPSRGQIETAVHEAGHAVLGQVLAGYVGIRAASIWPSPAGDGNWLGMCEGLEYRSGESMSIADAWAMCIIAYAGASAERALKGLSLEPDDVREDYWASGDEAMAQAIVSHFWPDYDPDELLTRAAEFAVQMVTRADVWRAIIAVADHLAPRKQIGCAELGILIQRFIYAPIQAPGLNWALALI